MKSAFSKIILCAFAFLGFSLSHNARGEGAQYLVSGISVPRASLSECERDKEPFETKLKKLFGLTLIEPMTCINNENSGSALSFKAVSSKPENSTVTEGGAFNSKTYCEISKIDLSSQLKIESIIIESTCAQNADGSFTPKILTLKTKSPAQFSERYESLHALIESSDVVKAKYLYR